MNQFDELNLDTSLGEYSEEDVREFFCDNDFRDSPQRPPPPPPGPPPCVTPPLDFGFAPVQPAPGPAKTSAAAVMFSLSIDQLMQEKNDAVCRRLTGTETQISLLQTDFSVFKNSVKRPESSRDDFEQKVRGEQRALEKKLRDEASERQAALEKKARDDQRAFEKKLRDEASERQAALEKKARDDQRAFEKKLREEVSERQTAFEKKQRDDQRALEKKLRDEVLERQTAFEKRLCDEALERQTAFEKRLCDEALERQTAFEKKFETKPRDERVPEGLPSAVTEARFATVEAALKSTKSVAQSRLDNLETKVAELERAQKKQRI